MPHVDNVATLEGAEKDEKKAMKCEGVPPTRKHARTNGNMLCESKYNRAKSEHTHKVRESE